MNKRIRFSGMTVVLVAVVISLLILHKVTATTEAATNTSHAGHDHQRENSSEAQHEEAQHEETQHEEAQHEEAQHEEAQHEEAQHEEAQHEEAQHEGHDHGDHAGEGGICPEHDVPEAEDALCHGDLLADLQPGEGMMVRLASPEVAARAGVGLVEAQEVILAAGPEFPGRVKFNRNHLARITPLSSGVIRKVNVRPGARVNEGDVLAEIAMPEIASLKASYRAANARREQAEANYRREKDLLKRGISSRREFQKADAEFRSAQSASKQYRQQLLDHGLAPDDIDRVSRDGSENSTVPLRAPFAGTVVEMEAALGEAVEPGRSLFTVSDLDTLWIEISVPEARIYQVRLDAPVQVRFDGLAGMVFTGSVFQTGAALDERSRTLRILAEVKNTDHRLKVGMFGKARILQGDDEQVLAVPTDAIQTIDGGSYVYVQQEPDLFEMRRVRPGAARDDVVPVLAGLSAGEKVVGSQGFALKSEVLKARLGASCADH